MTRRLLTISKTAVVVGIVPIPNAMLVLSQKNWELFCVNEVPLKNIIDPVVYELEFVPPFAI